MEEVGDRNGGSPGGGLNPNAAAFTPPVAGPSSRSRNQTRNRQKKGQTKKKASAKQPREHQTGSALSRELEKAFYSGGRSGEEFHRQRQQRHQRDRGKGRYRGRQNQDRVAKFDKDLFVQANNRFLVSDAVDVGAYDQDPDKLLDWDDVALVSSISAHDSESRCPICLEDDPICAQTTTCGHAFCLPCILRCATSSGGGCRQELACPLCFAPISIMDLRSLRRSKVQPPEVGREMTFELLHRKKGSIFPCPGAPRSVAGECHRFAKFTTTSERPFAEFTEGQVADLERRAAEMAAEGSEGSLASVYLGSSVLRERLDRWRHRRDSKMRAAAGEPEPEDDYAGPSLLEMAELAAVRAKEVEDGAKAWPSLTSKPARPSETRTSTKAPKPKAVPKIRETLGGEFYSYFQCSTGQNVFLHPVSMKVVMHGMCGNDLESAPGAVTGKVLELEDFVITPERRKQFRFLSHLPLGSLASAAELDLGVSTTSLPPQVVEEMTRRKKARDRQTRRRQKERREREREERERTAPLDAEFFRMRPPSSGGDEGNEPSAAVSADLGSSPATQQSGISYASLAGLGFGAGLQSPAPGGGSGWGAAAAAGSRDGGGGGGAGSSVVWLKKGKKTIMRLD